VLQFILLAAIRQARAEMTLSTKRQVVIQ